jgi:glucose/arabinose dehydrogenase
MTLLRTVVSWHMLVAIAALGSAVAQAAQSAETIRETLQRIQLPPGFRIELYAQVPDARHMAVAPQANLLFVGTRRNTVWAVADRNADGVADEVKSFAPAVRFNHPNGVCFAPGGALLVVETNRILSFPAVEASYDKAEVPLTEVVREGKLIPPEEESSGHGSRVCRVGPDGLLYVSLGQPYNVQPRAKLKLYDEWGIGGIVRMSPLDGSRREVYASGIRNSVGHDFNPKDGTLWFTDNQTDGMGDDIPTGEINRATAKGQFFGYPWKQGRTRITEHGYDRDPLPPNIIDPQVYTVAHAADLGMSFYTGTSFPAKYRGGFFSAQHGSWNRSQPVGAQVLFTSLKADGTADKTEVFAHGWLAPSGRYLGRPVDVAVLKDGSLLISDDYAGAIYRVRYAP